MSTLNNNLPATVYTPQYIRTLNTVFAVKQAFGGAFEPLQWYDGVRHNSTVFTVKTNNMPVVMSDYDNTIDINDTRFGDADEVIYTDTDVKYSYLLKTNEAIDKTTVNNDLDEAIADRLLLVAEKNVQQMNNRNGVFLSENASVNLEVDAIDNDTVLKIFNDLSAHFINNRIIVPKTAYVTPDLYNAIVDHPLVSTGKNSTVNIDTNGILYFKGFRIEETPEDEFVEGEIAYATADRVCIPFVGIIESRIITTERFLGFLLQSLGKGGTFILDDNKKAVVKVTLK